MKPQLTRLCIYPKDIQIITGKSERYSRDLIQKIKKHFNKEEHQLVTFQEFCEYMGIPLTEVQAVIRG
ncbi:hypothetical protein [Chryseobacterium lacus]|uniref:hypothetical protein n=1 Tax=Chryseobacterium lacus TaxID=2058346 RepID=UPI00086E862B|nr:hypothetical protein [Chryseobacterium lacus]ODS88847.1 MAG: hypothetical protein ABS44_07500 [Chryseobacterium sp. SCN 40-13]RST26332.1 hypothetical protein EIZ46_06765 [Chryseobacterium lacus]